VSNLTFQPRTIRITTGQYAGDDSANKAIAHGLGMIPKWVYVSGIAGQGFKNVISDQDRDAITAIGAAGAYAVTAMDSTNFYVGNATSYANSANQAGVTYAWVALGGS